MKLFGEYLIEKGIVTKDALVQGLIEQMRTTPSVAEIIWEKKLLSPDVLLEVMKIQHLKQMGFIEAAKHMKVWSSEISAKVAADVAEKKQPLGEIFVKQGVLSIEKMTAALDEFLSEQEDEPVATVTPAPKEATPIPTVTAEPVPTMSALEIHSGGSLVELLAPDRKSAILQVFHNLKRRSADPVLRPEIEKLLKRSTEVFRIMQGAAKLGDYAKCDQILTLITGILRDFEISGYSKLNDFVAEKMEGLGAKSVEILWSFGEFAALGKSEDDWLTDKSRQQEVDKLVKDLDTLFFDLNLM